MDGAVTLAVIAETFVFLLFSLVTLISLALTAVFWTATGLTGADLLLIYLTW